VTHANPSVEVRESESAWAPWARDLSLAALVGALTAYCGVRDGGFFPGTAALGAAEVALCIALVLVIARRPWDGIGVPVIVGAAALGGLAAWTLVSSDWSETPVRAMLEYTRVLLYALTFLLFGLLAFSARRVRWMLYSVAAACVAVCVLALIARTLPDVIFTEGLADEDRLGYPLNYWNALALVAGVGIIFCGHLSCSTRDPWPARILGAAAIPVLTATLYYTLSRGGTWATIAGVVIYVVVGRPRGLLSGAIATVPPVVVMLLILNPPNDLTDPVWAVPEVVAAGHHAALVIGLAAAAAAAIRTVLLFGDHVVVNLHLPERIRRPVLAGATIATIAVVTVGAAALQVPDTVSAKYDEFQSDDGQVVSGGGARLLSAQSNGRHEHWDVAFAAFRRDRLHGSGAGMYAVDWARERKNSASVQDGHSLYIEMLGELGWPGLVLVAIALLAAIGGFAFRARGPDRAMFAALVAAGLAWAAQASVDWLWEMPAVTLWLFAFGGAVLARRAHSDAKLPAWTIAIRVVGVALCAAVMILPTRVAVSQARIDTGLDAMEDGNCNEARSEARRALDVVPERALPYKLIGFCDLEQGHPRWAVRAMRAAVKRDPYSWELHYALGVARATAGLDPRRAIRRAAILNPGQSSVRAALEVFAAAKGKRWRRAGADLRITTPGPPTP
jgi:O-antigen ligase